MVTHGPELDAQAARIRATDPEVVALLRDADAALQTPDNRESFALWSQLRKRADQVIGERLNTATTEPN